MEFSDINDLTRIVHVQEERKRHCINLIASENIISDRVNRLQASLLSNRYVLDDFPNNDGLFEIKKKLIQQLCTIFNAKYANVSPLSGMNCMELIIGNLTGVGDNVYTINPLDGGHTSTQRVCDMFRLKTNYLRLDHIDYRFDLTEIENDFTKNAPRLIYLDNTIICFYSPITELCDLAKRYGAKVVYDGSHVLGLIAGKAYPNPLDDGADILCGSTHKTFFGAQKGIILTNGETLIDKIDCFSSEFVSSIHTGSLLALYMSVLEMSEFGSDYAEQVIKNAKALGRSLSKCGVVVPTIKMDVTETHQVWIDTGKEDPQRSFEMLAQCNINTNPIRIPAIQKMGLRLGTAEVTRLGMKEGEMRQIAGWISEILLTDKNRDEIRSEIIDFCDRHSKIHFTFDNDHVEKQRFTVNQSGGEKLNHFYMAKQYERDILAKIPCFCGMILRGGVGRGTADDFSDIDFTGVFDSDDVERVITEWGLKKGMHLHNEITFSGRYVSLTSFRQKEWTAKMKHAYQYAKFINCSAAVKEIIKAKTEITNSEQLKRVVSNIIELGEICKVFETYRGFEMFSEIYKQYSRGEFLVANMEIDRAVKYIKNIIFDINKIHYPEEKSYYVRFFTNLPKQPYNLDSDIELLLQIPRDENNFENRLSFLVSLAQRVLAYCERNVSLPKDIYKYYLEN